MDTEIKLTATEDRAINLLRAFSTWRGTIIEDENGQPKYQIELYKANNAKIWFFALWDHVHKREFISRPYTDEEACTADFNHVRPQMFDVAEKSKGFDALAAFGDVIYEKKARN